MSCFLVSERFWRTSASFRVAWSSSLYFRWNSLMSLSIVGCPMKVLACISSIFIRRSPGGFRASWRMSHMARRSPSQVTGRFFSSSSRSFVIRSSRPKWSARSWTSGSIVGFGADAAATAAWCWRSELARKGFWAIWYATAGLANSAARSAGEIAPPVVLGNAAACRALAACRACAACRAAWDCKRLAVAWRSAAASIPRVSRCVPHPRQVWRGPKATPAP
mmetsp:Transcript_29145/g.82236  ORF Transcript_29145/g.82236 Transcript_29145/m.82236 type:complete len:221 (+) Transcript_29145:333-995(+)